MSARIIVSAVCVFAPDGRLLTVRKNGTDRFMHPGGKPEPGESAAEAASRELAEEVGIEVPARELGLMGFWVARAANEAGTDIEATVFTAPGFHDPAEIHPAREIAELRWLDVDGELPPDLAPLLTDHVIPALVAQSRRGDPSPTASAQGRS